ncbi:family 2 glycosyl transferase [Candidatus Magnetobacterium bavaricum]|uniref:Family 2 glycosyl transferase n=1 Tax=Candidatus Magnetobacterium bavaricum TaxID=29290 RepID=A0A0F3GV30_9BACT|nr:family 2 glycosyl transferase [Candidatus Magnetobacterium bavaricum]
MVELSVIMPVYNEAGLIGVVLAGWLETLDALGIEFQFHVYNDGSRDGTGDVIDRLSQTDGRVVAHHKANTGHGATILKGYRDNCTTAQWLLQTDSDGETSPADFYKLWQQRQDYDILLGRRAGRNVHPTRNAITLASRALARGLFGAGIVDVNSPYRLMRSDAFKDCFYGLPDDTFAPNVAISATACLKKLRILEIPVACKERTKGTTATKRIVAGAIKSVFQLLRYRIRLFG